MSRVIILDAEYEAIDVAVRIFLGAFGMDWKEKTVLLKPNMLSYYPPERHLTTNPAVIRSLLP